jgi:ABC-type methionine transport system ATPase subunit
VVRERSRGILLVEHDMTLVRDICDYIYVLEFGQLIFEGTAEEMQHSPQVRAAYLGDFADPAADAPQDQQDAHNQQDGPQDQQDSAAPATSS